MRRFTFAEIWDVLVFVILFPLVLGLGVQLPGDWAHHQGASLPGTATVTALDDFRGGKIVLVDVRDRSGHVVTRRQEVSGEAPRLMGATFAVLYLPSDEPGDTQVYVAGHDPFAENAAVLVPVGLAWLVSLPFVGARFVKLARWVGRRLRKPPTGQYRAGRGYVQD